MKKFNVNVGDKFKNWTIIKEILPSPKGGRKFLVECKCSRQSEVFLSKLRANKSTQCKVCQIEGQTGNKNSSWKGCGELSATMWSRIIHNATSNDLKVSISMEYAYDLFLKQNKKCALSGQDLIFSLVKEQTASLDRIDSSKGYVEGNVQWVHKEINSMKVNFDEQYFISLCDMIVEHSKKKNVC